MSQSSRLLAAGGGESSRVELPVFISPAELNYAPNKKRCLLTIFNPYNNEAQFRIMTTNPERYDVSIIKGTIKPGRRIDITIRLYIDKLLDDPTDEPRVIDYFRVSMQMGPMKGSKPIKVLWQEYAESIEANESISPLIGTGGGGVVEDRSPSSSSSSAKLRMKSMKPSGGLTSSASPIGIINSPSTSHISQRNPKLSTMKPTRQQLIQAELMNGGSNVNLVCTICALACVFTLFLPLSIDSELCKKVISYPTDQTSTSTQAAATGIISQLSAFFRISYEMKLGCSFALGLFTYRLISTLPD